MWCIFPRFGMLHKKSGNTVHNCPIFKLIMADGEPLRLSERDEKMNKNQKILGSLTQPRPGKLF
jgi:hypothetical protein